jgi:hypothetical protein
MNTPFNLRIALRQRFAVALVYGATAAGALVAIEAAAAQQRLATPSRASSLVDSAALAETARTPYQAFLYPPDCVASSNICRLTSDTVPRRRRLEIRQLACQGVHSGNLLPTVTGNIDLETAAGAFVTRLNLLDGRYTRNPGSTLAAWTISQPTLMFVPANHRTKITISTGSPVNSSSGCTISGYLVTLDRP